MKIGNMTLQNNIFLAPMAGVTDIAFRLLCKEMGCGFVYSEMVSAKGLLYGSKNTNQLLQIEDKEKPVAVQLFGSEPQILAQMAKNLEPRGFDSIDVNMGCPAQKIVKNGEGSALMLTPKRIGEIVNAIVKAQNKPVTIKIRKGFDDGQCNAVEVAKIAEANGASAIAVHGRTREQFYSGKADWNCIRAVKQAVSIPVIGNGDVFTPQEAKALLEETGCDAVMIARGAQGNPWIFRRTLEYLKTGVLLEEPTPREKIEMGLRHAKMLIAYKGEYIGIREMRKHLSWYLKELHGAAQLRVDINQAQSYCEIEEKLYRFLEKAVYSEG